MSFGCSVGDFILLVQIAHKTFRNCQSAGNEYLEIASEVRCLHSVLRTLRAEAQRPESKIFKQDAASTAQLIATAEGCKNVLNTLDYILAKYEGLKIDGQASATKKVWQKFRFGSKSEELGVIRGKLITYTSTISILIDTMQLQATDRVETKIDGGFAEMTSQFDKMRKEIYAIASEARAEERKGIAMSTLSLSTYAGDEKVVWQDFRRELVKKGFRSQNLEKHKELLLAYMVKLDESGLLDQSEILGGDRSNGNQWWSKRMYLETINSLADLQVAEGTPNEEHQALPSVYTNSKTAVLGADGSVSAEIAVEYVSIGKERPLAYVNKGTLVKDGSGDNRNPDVGFVKNKMESISDCDLETGSVDGGSPPIHDSVATLFLPALQSHAHLVSNGFPEESNERSRDSVTAQWLSTRIPQSSKKPQPPVRNEIQDLSAEKSSTEHAPSILPSTHLHSYVTDEDEERSLYEVDPVDDEVVSKITKQETTTNDADVPLGIELTNEVTLGFDDNEVEPDRHLWDELDTKHNASIVVAPRVGVLPVTYSNSKPFVGFSSNDEWIEEGTEGARAGRGKRKGILKKPTAAFPEEPHFIREGVLPLKDAPLSNHIPPEARWTKISRALVNPEALESGKERYEVRDGDVIILRVLSRAEVQGYAEATQRIRAARGETDEEYRKESPSLLPTPTSGKQKERRNKPKRISENVLLAAALLGKLANAYEGSSPRRER